MCINKKSVCLYGINEVTKTNDMKNLKFTKEKAYDKGYGWQHNYTCGKWSITNVDTCWMVMYDSKDITTTKTLKEAKASVCGIVAFNEDLI